MNFRERGQEEIFESAAPASSTAVAPREERAEDHKPKIILDSDNIVTTTISPDQAYEIFQGKFFGVLKMKEKEQLHAESTTQKLSRIQQELQEISNDIDKVLKSKGKPDQADILKTLRENADAMSQKALQLKTHPVLTGDLANPDLDQKLKRIQMSIQSEAPRPSLLTSDDDVSLARRVSVLEAVLGSASNVLDVESVYGVVARNKVFPLADSILGLEQRLALFDEHNLDVLRNKAKALRIELEAVNKISSAPQSLAEQRVAAENGWKRVSDLHDKLKRVEATADDLPALVLRLKTLEGIHQAAGTFSQRVQEVETAAENLSTMLKSNREILEMVKKSLKDNAAVMLSNAAEVDARIAALKKR